MAETIKKYSNVKVTPLEKSEVEIEAEIPYELVAKERAAALKELNKTATIPGFRSGHIPEKILVERLGEITILEKAAERILPEATYHIIVDSNIESIGRPSITITKIAAGAPIGFKVRTAIVPKITAFPDYKVIAKKENLKKKEEISVEEKEVDAIILEFRKNQAYQNKLEKEKNGEVIDLTPEELFKEENLPPFDDELAKKIGSFAHVEDFRSKVRENIKKEKEQKAREKLRMQILEHILQKTEVVIPDLLIDEELQRMWARFLDDVERMGVHADQYLAHIRKTQEELLKEWRDDAEKKVKLQLILDKIAKEENLKPDEELLRKETEHLLSHHKDALPDRARNYVEMVLTNEKVLEFLENQR
jgi:trigger factor